MKIERNEKLIDVTQISEFLNVSKKTVRRLAKLERKGGGFDSIRVAGRIKSTRSEIIEGYLKCSEQSVGAVVPAESAFDLW